MVPDMQVCNTSQQTNMRGPHRIQGKEAHHKRGERKTFFTGGNSSCWAHIRQHYTLYSEHCKKENIRENHHILPWPLYQKMKEVGKKSTGSLQLTLDCMLEKKSEPKVFTCEGIMHAVAKFIVCDDQVQPSSLKSWSLWYRPLILSTRLLLLPRTLCFPIV